MDKMVHLDAGGAVGDQHEYHGQESLQDERDPCAASEHFCPWSSAISNWSAGLASLSAPSSVAVSVQLHCGVLQSSVQSCGVPSVALWIPSRVHDSEQLVSAALRLRLERSLFALLSAQHKSDVAQHCCV